jgi:hypothetical protein
MFTLNSATKAHRSIWTGSKKASFKVRLSACMALFLALVLTAPAVWAGLDNQEQKEKITYSVLPVAAAAATASFSPIAGKLDSALDGRPRITLAADTEGAKPVDLELDQNTQVVLNGSPANLSDLQSGDQVKVVAGTNGQTTLTAVRSKPTIVLGANGNTVKMTTDYMDKFSLVMASAAKVTVNGNAASLADLKKGDHASIVCAKDGTISEMAITRQSLLVQFWNNFRSNLFKPLLLFFYLGFSIPLLKIAFEFPQQIYQGLTIYLLIAIGWHGGEELAVLSQGSLSQALSFVAVGLITNTLIGLATYSALRNFVPKMRKIDSATVAAYYGSDSAGTFVTCLGVLQAAHIAFAAYMPVMLAAMEVPGCLVGLYLVSRLRKSGMDAAGNMPGEPGYNPDIAGSGEFERYEGYSNQGNTIRRGLPSGQATAGSGAATAVATREDVQVALPDGGETHSPAKLLREVFLNPGIILLFGGITVGFLSRQQGLKVVQADDQLFVTMFQGMLCLFLLEMGMTAARRLQDLKTASWRFVAFALIAPNIFACFGIAMACIFSHIIGQPLQLGTYTLFAVLCAAASYIAVPAIQRIAIPEASPTLPLAASLGLTFSYNVTVGIPLYLVIAQQVVETFPVGM